MMDGIDKTIENEDELQLDEMESPQSEVTSLTKELAATKEKLTSLQRDFDKSEDRWKQAEQTNTDLEKRIESMNKELNIFRESTKKDTVDVASQTVPSSDRVIQSQGAVPENLPKNPGPSGWVGNENSEGPSQSIADSVKAAAEAAVNRTGFVLDRTSGMYYDCNSGYYYDQVNQLYYDPTTGIYYYFDDTTDSYQFHSQVDLQTSALAKPERYGKGKGLGRKNDRRKEKTPESRKREIIEDMDCEIIEPTPHPPLKRRRRGSQAREHGQGLPDGRGAQGTDRRFGNERPSRRVDDGRDNKVSGGHDHRGNGRERTVERRRHHSRRQRREKGYRGVTEDDHCYIKRQLEVAEAVSDGEMESEDEAGPRRGGGRSGKRSPPDGISQRRDRSGSRESPEKHSGSGDKDGSGHGSGGRRVIFLNPSSVGRDRHSVARAPSRDRGGDSSSSDGEIVEDITIVDDGTELIILSSDDMEEGELSDSLSVISSSEGSFFNSESKSSDDGEDGDDDDYGDDGDDDDLEGLSNESDNSDEIEVLKVNYAPCVRMIVTKSDSLKPGSLYIVTCSGGTIGREGSNHSVVIQSVKVSKRHAKLVYDSNERHYTIVDLGSQNGTLLNGKAISEQRVVSAPHRLTHRDYLTIGGTTLRVHIHNGDETCEECEPGQVQALMALQQQSESHGTAVTVGGSRQDKEQQRRKELRQLKKKYSLSKEGYTQGGDPATMNPSYVDRAGVRQRTVGSDNPYQADDAPASVDRAISSTNLGHKLLSKMGWSEGQSLGKGEQGIKEPVQAVIHSRNAGLGASSARSIEQASYARRKNERFDKARERFYKGTEPTTSKGTTWVHGGTKTESSSPMVQLPLAATNKHEMHRSRDEDVVEICDDMPTGVASDLGRGKSGGGSRPMKLSDRAGISGEQELLTEIFTERQKWDESGDASTRTEQKSDNHISEIMEGGGSADTSCSSGGDPLSLRDGEIDDAAANEITDGLEQAESSCISEKPVLADSGPDRTEPVKSIKLKWNKAGIKEKQRPINLPAFGESESGDEMESGENGQVTTQSQPESRTDKSGKDKPSRWSQSSKSSTK